MPKHRNRRLRKPPAAVPAPMTPVAVLPGPDGRPQVRRRQATRAAPRPAQTVRSVRSARACAMCGTGTRGDLSLDVTNTAGGLESWRVCARCDLTRFRADRAGDDETSYRVAVVAEILGVKLDPADAVARALGRTLDVVKVPVRPRPYSDVPLASRHDAGTRGRWEHVDRAGLRAVLDAIREGHAAEAQPPDGRPGCGACGTSRTPEWHAGALSVDLGGARKATWPLCHECFQVPIDRGSSWSFVSRHDAALAQAVGMARADAGSAHIHDFKLYAETPGAEPGQPWSYLGAARLAELRAWARNEYGDRRGTMVTPRGS